MKSLLMAAALGLLSQTVSADQILDCVIGNQTDKQGTARIEVLDVTNDSTSKILKIDLISKVRNPNPNSTEQTSVHLQGVIAARLSGPGAVFANGTLFNSGDASVPNLIVINPPTISLQSHGVGFSRMSLIDSDRVLQHGFGVAVDCK